MDIVATRDLPPLPVGRLTARRSSRRALLRVAGGATGAGVVAAACGAPQPAGQTDGSKGAASGPVTIVWGIRTSTTPDQIDALLDSFKALRPNIHVEQYPAPGGIDPSTQKLSTALVAGNPLDVISGHLSAGMLIEAIDALQPIDDLVKRDKFDLRAYNKDFLDSAGMFRGKLAALPYAYGGDLVAVVYNRSMFRAAGIQEPSPDWKGSWTWDQWREAARRLTITSGTTQTQVGVAGYGYWLNTPTKPWETGWLAADMKTLTCDSPATLEAYAKFGEMMFKDRSYAQSPGAELGAGDPFYNTKAGMAMVCCAALGFVEKIAGFDWAFAPMPRGKVASYDMAPTVMGMAKPSTQRDASWEFIKFLSDKANLAKAERLMPATLPDLDAWVADTFSRWPDSRAQVLAEGARIARPLEPLRLHPRWAPMSSEILEPAWKDVLDQKIAIPDMIRTVKPLLQRMLDDFERTRRS